MGAVDQKLLSASWRKTKASNARNSGNLREGGRENVRSVAKTASGLTSAGGAVQAGVSTGLRLRRQISEGGFDEGTFILVLILSLIKDFWDVTVGLVDLGITGSIINIFITIVLRIIFFFQSSMLKRYLIKRFLWPMIAEEIPLLNIFPSYTIMTILLKREMDSKMKKWRSELEEEEKKESSLKYLAYEQAV